MINKIVFPDKFTFPQVVKGLSNKGCKVFPIDPDRNKVDSFVINSLKKETKKMISGNMALQGKGKTRINDINESVMDILIDGLKRSNPMTISIEKLKMNSFADMKIFYPQTKETYYVEIVCTTKYEFEGDSLRCIYLSSNLRNINSDGKHILIMITFDIDEINRLFIPKKSMIYDLYDAGMNLKIEYSASLDDVSKLEEL